jgi:hypothetical protein
MASGVSDERGGATSPELALLWIALIGLIGAVIQVALLFYAGQLALAAAQDGLRTGRYYTTNPATDSVTGSVTEVARQDAEAFLARAAGTALTSVTVHATIGNSGVLRVQVTGTALSLVPGVPLTVSREAVGPAERITP